MDDETKKPKKGLISEEDISDLLQRYSVTTVLTLLQEVAQVPDVKIDWNAMVEKTKTGISNAREYHMLWRYLAYRNALPDKLGSDDGAQPQDDDSDIDYELEAFPPISADASTEAAAYVKVLDASSLPNDSDKLDGSTVEAPLTINIPSGQSSRDPENLVQGTNITVPVNVLKDLPNVAFPERVDASRSASSSLPAQKKRKPWSAIEDLELIARGSASSSAAQKKRKPWSATEDLELIAAVQKHGEGNWTNILKGDFRGDRTAKQLYQRWARIRKRMDNSNVGSGTPLSKAQLSDRPLADNPKATGSIAGLKSDIMPSKSAHSTAAEVAFSGGQIQYQSAPASIPSHQPGTSGSSSKSPVGSEQQLTKSGISPDEMVKAAALAAGARIGTPSDAVSLLKAAQAKNIVHIIPGESSLIKSNIPCSANPIPGFPNVHFIRNGLTLSSSSTYSPVPSVISQPDRTQKAQDRPVNAAASAVQFNSSRTVQQVNASSEISNSAATSIVIELENNSVNIISCSGNAPLRISKGNGATLTEPHQHDRAAFSDIATREEVIEDQVSFQRTVEKEQVQEDHTSVSGNILKAQIKKAQVSRIANARHEQVQEDQTATQSSERIVKNDVKFIVNSKCLSNAEKAVNNERLTISNPNAAAD